MNKILLSQAKPLKYNGEEQLAIPFISSDVGQAHLHAPAYNRTSEENQLAEDLSNRLEKALASHGLVMVGLSFTSMTVYAKRNA